MSRLVAVTVMHILQHHFVLSTSFFVVVVVGIEPTQLSGYQALGHCHGGRVGLYTPHTGPLYPIELHNHKTWWAREASNLCLPGLARTLCPTKLPAHLMMHMLPHHFNLSTTLLHFRVDCCKACEISQDCSFRLCHPSTGEGYVPTLLVICQQVFCRQSTNIVCRSWSPSQTRCHVVVDVD